jgi:AcrR family transcriptional regulator
MGDAMQEDQTQPDTPKRRNAEATKEAILSAAQRLFSAHGYDGVGTREIAAQAGCNVALVSRYFGSKTHLFRTALKGCVDFDPMLALPREHFAEALADHLLSKEKNLGAADPMYAALRSCTSPEATLIAREELSDRMTRVLAEYLGGGPQAERTAALILSLMAGFDVGRHLIGNHALEPVHDQHLRPMLAAAIRAIIEAEPEDLPNG